MRRARPCSPTGLCLLLAAAVCATSFTGCGGSSRAIPQAARPGAGKASGDFRIVIRVPKAPGNPHHLRGSRYISPSMQSLTVSIDDGTPIAFGITPTSPGCAFQNGNPPLTCTVTLSVGAGNHTASVNTYDGANGTGNLLSTNSTVPLAISAGQTNTLNITLNGMLASIQLLLTDPNPPLGTPANIALSVNGYDADANLIVGPGMYENGPITISDSDNSGATQLSTTTVSDPTVPVSVAYNGNPIPGGSATFSASAASIQTTGGQNAVLTPSTHGSTQFGYIGQSDQYFTVPAGVNAIQVDAYGGEGGVGNGGWNDCEHGICNFGGGGNGDRVTATIPVSPGDQLVVMVGAMGSPGNYGNGYQGGPGGWPGGGSGGAGAGGGGGWTAILRNGAIAIMAGGGGGGADMIPALVTNGNQYNNLSAGGTSNQNGYAGYSYWVWDNYLGGSLGGSAGSQTSFGRGGAGYECGSGDNGGDTTEHWGGNGGTCSAQPGVGGGPSGGGGGGAGFAGGGGGGGDGYYCCGPYYAGAGAGGGGGSSWVEPSAYNVQLNNPQGTNNGLVILTW